MRRTALSALIPIPVILVAFMWAGSGAVEGWTRCSRPTFPITRTATNAYFIGTAGDDTVHAGRGGVPIDVDERPREVYGQVVTIDSVGGDVPQALRDAVSGGRGQAVVVPWESSVSCSRVTWRGSARWTTAGVSAFYAVQLRPQHQWRGSTPVFDGFGRLTPYEAPASGHQSRLLSHQYFSLYDALPTESERRAADPEAMQRLRSWFERNPQLVQLSPAAEIMNYYRNWGH